MAGLGGTSGLSAGEGAERTAMYKVQVSCAVETLVRPRPAATTPDAGDGRVQRLALTAKGRAIYDEVVPLALLLEEVLLSALTLTERAKLDALMEKLARQTARLGDDRV